MRETGNERYIYVERRIDGEAVLEEFIALWNQQLPSHF
jgi:hypothetical protein